MDLIFDNNLFGQIGVKFGGNNTISVVFCNNIFITPYFIYRVLNDGRGFNGSLLMAKARYALSEYGYLSTENIIHIFACAVLMTLLRYFLNFVIFKVTNTCVRQ